MPLSQPDNSRQRCCFASKDGQTLTSFPAHKSRFCDWEKIISSTQAGGQVVGAGHLKLQHVLNAVPQMQLALSREIVEVSFVIQCNKTYVPWSSFLLRRTSSFTIVVLVRRMIGNSPIHQTHDNEENGVKLLPKTKGLNYRCDRCCLSLLVPKKQRERKSLCLAVHEW